MDANFPKCLALVLQSEGGNDDDPHDPGGRTSRGISQQEYDAYRKHKHESVNDVFNASDGEIADIYQVGYWEPWCGKLPAGVDYTYFDMCVNQGPHEATLLLQRALKVTADGRMGVVTFHSLATANLFSTVISVASERRSFYRHLSMYKYFGKGWMARVARVEQDSIKMISEAV